MARNVAVDIEDDDEVFRLRDMKVPEVSTVDRGANKKKRFLVVKRGGAMTDPAGAELTPTDNGEFTTTEKQVSIPKPVKAAVMRTLTEVLERLRSIANKAKTAAEPPATFSKDVEAIAAMLDSVVQKYPYPGQTKKDEDSEKIQHQAAGKTILNRVTAAIESIMSIMTTVRGATETTERSASPLPTAVGQAVGRVAGMLRALAQRYPSPASKEATMKNDATGDAATANAADGAAAKPNDGEDTTVAKGGARMSKSRLERFQSALKSLQDVLKELVKPDKPAEPTGPTAGAAEIGKAIADALGPVVKSLTEDVKGLRDEVKGVSKRNDEQIAQLRKMHGGSNAIPVDGGAQPTAAVSWPMDLNKPISRDSVKKEVSFFDEN